MCPVRFVTYVSGCSMSPNDVRATLGEESRVAARTEIGFD